jgi:hypothetical protein
MVTGVDIKLIPVPGTTSGEMFKYRLTRGTTLTFDIDNYTTITTNDGGVITSEFFPVDSDKLLTVSEVGVDFQNPLIKLPVNQIRFILCYNS